MSNASGGLLREHARELRCLACAGALEVASADTLTCSRCAAR